MEAGKELLDLDNIITLRNEQADEIILKSTGKVSALAALPIPLLDIAGMTYIQISMVKKLATLHNVEIKNENVLLLSSLVASLLSKLISELLDQLTESTGLQNLIGESLVKATIAGFLTQFSGELYQNHFSNGGTLADIQLSSVKDHLVSQLQSDRYSVDKLLSSMMDSSFKKLGVS